MVALVKSLGILIVILGVAYLMKPPIMKKVIKFWMEKKNMYVGLAINVIVGILLLLAAWQCSLPWVVMAVGVLSLLKVLLAVGLGLDKSISRLERLSKANNKTLRAWSIIVIAMGALIIYSA